MTSTLLLAGSTTHERDIPSIADQAAVAEPEVCYTELSFCLPTSLAFAKRLTWEQTPWIHHSLNHKSTNPIEAADAHRIACHLSSHLDEIVAPENIQNALLFGSTYPTSPSDAQLDTYPQLFVVFPHARSKPSTDENFLKVWHDQIVKPAFDRAWKESGLTTVYGADMDSQAHILPASGTHTARDSLPAKGFLQHLRNGNPTAVRDYWPVWNDNWGVGSEGQYTGLRTKIYTKSWEAIQGMLKGHPELPSHQEPILLALCRSKVYVEPGLSAPAKLRCTGQEWDKFVDSRFLKQGSFKAIFQTVIGMQDQGEDQEQGGPALLAWIAETNRWNAKRMAADEGAGEGKEGKGNAHRDKRARRGE